MKTKQLLMAVVLLVTGAAATLAQEFQLPPIPVDNAVRTGKLSNGLTYYVRQNGYPEHRVNFYIAQRVGSIQENDDQRGLAHFLEHMAFNGSDNFKDNNLIEYLRSIGVEFGSDLNAYTSIDQTVYRICNVPSTRVSALDSCLLVLKDWSNGLTLDTKEIDKERGVIHEEWRLRTNPIMRMLERNLEKIYPGSKYGQRMPIGKMEIIDNFEPDVLRKYYQKWYRPDNQAIIVVGDIDVDRTEQKIKELFGGIVLQPNAAQVVDEQVPDNAEAIILIDKDKEQQQDLIMVNFKHDAVPDSLKSSLGYMIQQYAVSLANQMLNQRLDEKSKEANCPYTMAFANDGDFIFAKTKGALDLTIIPKDSKVTEAVSAATREVIRAVKFGFTPTEFVRAKEEYMSQLEKTYTNRNKRKNDVYGDIYRDHFLSNEPMPSIEDEYQIMQQLSQVIPVEAVNELIKENVSQTDSNLVVFVALNEKEGRVYPTVEEVHKAISDVHAENLEAWVDNVKNEPLISVLPKKGTIKSEKENTRLGYKELTLSNGVRVLLKKTDFKDDEIVMRAISKGGSSLLGNDDLVNAKVFDMVIASSGLGSFNSTELEKALAGKQASASLSLEKLYETVEGTSTPKDLETMFQLTYLNFTDITKDEKGFASLMAMLENALKNKSISPDQAFSDSVQCTLYEHNPRFTSLEMEDLKSVNYDRILQIAKERTANAADFTFTFVGNFDEAVIRPLIEQYIASLPSKGKKEDWKKVHTYTKGAVENKFLRKMETPKARVYMFWYNTEIPYSLENSILADAAGQILDMIYLKQIREEASAAYSANAFGYSELGSDTPYNVIIGICPFKPEKTDLALGIMNDELQKMAESVDADKLNKVKELLLKRADEDAKKNDHWLSVIGSYDMHGVDKYTDYKSLVNAMTPEKVSAFVKNVIIAGGNCVKVIMLPDESK
ncbi:MAG: M16 family metallopeptidase [Prevotella sp.]